MTEENLRSILSSDLWHPLVIGRWASVIVFHDSPLSCIPRAFLSTTRKHSTCALTSTSTAFRGGRRTHSCILAKKMNHGAAIEASLSESEHVILIYAHHIRCVYDDVYNINRKSTGRELFSNTLRMCEFGTRYIFYIVGKNVCGADEWEIQRYRRKKLLSSLARHPSFSDLEIIRVSKLAANRMNRWPWIQGFMMPVGGGCTVDNGDNHGWSPYP